MGWEECGEDRGHSKQSKPAETKARRYKTLLGHGKQLHAAEIQDAGGAYRQQASIMHHLIQVCLLWSTDGLFFFFTFIVNYHTMFF